MNILVLSAGTRNKIIQYFKKALDGTGNVIATDASKLGPAIYEADKHYIVPPISSPEYINTILKICKIEKIKGALSLIDPELSILAANNEKFNSIGVTIVGSSYELCEMALDKIKMYKWLKRRGFKCADSWMVKEEFFKANENGEVSYPVFVKPYRGSASLDIHKAYDKETINYLFSHTKNLMIQEYLNGQEIGGGSVRIHDPEMQQKIFGILGLTPETVEKRFKYLVRAFRYGAPPHAGLAYGLDRLVSIFAGLDSIRDCIAFPKNNSGRDVMVGAPTALEDEQLQELHLKLQPIE